MRRAEAGIAAVARHRYEGATATEKTKMAQAHGTPHFHNQPGLPSIRTSAREFMCIGALPPFDHPHIYIDMGDESDIVCSYCSTRFVYDASLKDLCAPADCLYTADSGRAA